MISSPGHARTLAGSFAFALAFPALAVSGDDLSRLSLEELLGMKVSTASKYAQTIGQAPSSVTVLTAADIRTFGYRTFADVLNAVRGVYVTSDHTYAFFGFRGFGRPGDYNGRVLVLIDGNRINENIFSGASIGTEFPLELEHIERVEFVSGPGSAIHGNNALFGVVNVITRRSGAGRAEVVVEAGTQATRRLVGTVSGKLAGGTSVLLSASGYASDGWARYYPEYDDAATPGGTAPRELDHDRVQRAFLRVDHGTFAFEILGSDRRKGIPSASYGQVFGDTRARTDDRLTLQQASWSGALAPGLDVFVRQFAGDSKYSGRYVYGESAAPAVNRDEAHGQWWGFEGRIVGEPGGGHKWVAGLEYQRNSRQRQKNFDEATGEVYFDDVRQSRTGSLYLQDEWAVRDDLRLTAGIHYGMQDSDARRLYPRLAAVYAPTAETTVKAIYGSAFRAPSVYEAYYPGVDQIAQNPALRSEVIDTTELVLEQRVGRSTRLTASAFRYQLHDLISLGVEDGSGLLQYQNLSQANAEGVELEGEHWFDSGARLKASLTLQRARDEVSGEWLDNSPRQIAKAHLSLPVGWGERGSIGVEGLYVGERATSRGGRVGAFGVLNVTLVATPWEGGPVLSASVYNLFDRHYGDPAAIEQFDSLGRTLNQIPRDGRSFRLVATARF